MKKQTDMLPAELLWEDNGHLTEVALNAVADAEDALLPANALAHLDACEHCLFRVGEVASMSIDMGIAMRAAEPQAAKTDLAPLSIAEESRRRAAMRPPRYAIGGALLLAALGSLPLIAHVPGLLQSIGFLFNRGVPVVAHMAARFATTAPVERIAMVLPFVSTFVLILLGVIVARALPRTARLAEGASA
jgi:hypothetical protein